MNILYNTNLLLHKYFLCLIALLFLSTNLQAQLVSISPTLAQPGETLMTTITAQNNFFTGSTVQLYLQHSQNNFIIEPDTFPDAPCNDVSCMGYGLVINADTVIAEFEIPSNAPFGLYNLHVFLNDGSSDILNDAFQVGDAGMTGYVYWDANSNGVQDAGDYGLANQAVLKLPDSVYTYTNSNGFYNFAGTFNNNYTIKLVPQANWAITSASTSYNVNLASNANNLNFGIHAINDLVAVQSYVWNGWSICNQNRTFYTKVQNTGTVSIDTGYVRYVKPSNTTYVSSATPPDLIIGDTLYWYYYDLQISQSKYFSVVLHIPASGSLVSEALAYGENYILSDDDTSYSNAQSTIACSFDPNDKIVDNDTISSLSAPLTYTINFQNTGTDTAFNVIVRDTLSNLLDLSTFQLVSSSDSVTIELEPNGALAFHFDNILLPDSTMNEPESHGMVVFSIIPNDSLPLGTTIHNTASIYFDINSPVLTNDATVFFCVPVSVNQSFILCNGDSVQVGSSWYTQSGTYTDSLLTVDGCDSIVTTQITASSVLVSINSTNTTCGLANGSATALPTGDASPFTYAWSGGNTVASVNNLVAGNYTVTVSDANACTASQTVTIDSSTAPVLSTIASPSTCANANGYIDLTVTDGTTPYSYAWSNATTSEDIINALAGTYAVTVTDANACTVSTIDTITNIAGPTLSFTTTNSICGNANGGVNLTVTGGTPPFTYNWSNGSTAQDLLAVAANTYGVTVTDANNCTAAGNATVANTPGPSLSTVVTAATCGLSNGSVNLTVISGTTPYLYAWTNGATMQDLANVVAGIYSVTVSDANNCSATTSAVVSGTPAIAISLTASPTSCGLSNGSVTSNINTGTAPFTFIWSNGATTQNVSNLASGNISITVTDANGCSTTQTVAIQSSTGITASLTATNSTCLNSNGAIAATATGAVAPYAYVWSTGATTQNVTNLTAGSYTVTITSSNGCTATSSITLTTSSPPVLTTTVTNAACGSTNGAVTLTVTGGTAPYTFAWSSGATTQNLNNVGAGNYAVTVTGANTCSASTTASVSNISGPTITTASTPTTCGQLNGTATLTVNGGTTPYTFTWSNGATTQNLTNVAGGNYNVTVQDSNNCIATASIVIGNTTGPSATLLSTNASCGNSNGSIAVNITSGTPPFIFIWNNGATTQNLINIAAATYTVTITDANNCTASQSKTITGTPSPLVTLSVNDATCSLDNAAIIANVTSGTAPYTYIWTNNGTAQSINNLPTGFYSVTVSDANSCTASASTTVTGTVAPLVSTSVNNASCDLSNGSVTLTVSGATTPYTFIWSNGATTQNLTNVPQGAYGVTVTSANGCSSSTLSIVNGTPATSFTLSAINTTCGLANGFVNLSFDSGTSPFVFIWSNGATTQSLINVLAGNYSVTVTDVNGCSSTQSIVVTDIPAPIINLLVTSSTCGQSNASILLTTSGGTPPFTFAWSNGDTTQNLINIIAGSYDVTVTDGNNCTSSQSIVVTDQPAPALTFVSTIASCGFNNGTINLTVVGGIAPYVFNWSNGSTTEDISGLAQGMYVITVTDINGCSVSDSVYIDANSPLVLDVITTDVGCGNTNGSIDLTVTGGTPPYSFTWSTGATTEDVSGLGTGTYSVTVTGSLGCTASTTASISAINGPAVTANTTQDVCGLNSGAIDVTITNGTTPYTVSWSNGSTTQDLSNLDAGDYSITITDAVGCIYIQTFNVQGTPPPVLSGILIAPSCGIDNGFIFLNVSGGFDPYTFVWSNASTTQDQTDLAAGDYTVTVFDVNGCSSDTTFNLLAVPAPQISSTVINTTCGEPNGVINITVSGGLQPYLYAWTNGSSDEDLVGVFAGTYDLTVTDDNGCTVSTQIIVGGTAGPQLSTVATDVTCGGSDGSIDITITGGAQPYMINWSNGATDEDLNNISAGIYSVTVLDANFCTASDVVTLNSGSGPYTNYSSTETSCNQTNGTVDVTVGGGTSPYTFNWSNGATTEDLVGLGVGFYFLTVTDVNGCSTTNDVLIVSGLGAPELSYISTASTCGLANGSVDLSVANGIPPFTFQWSNGATTEDLTNVSGGTYLVTVSDVNGCQGATLVNVGSMAPPIVSASSISEVCNNSNGAVNLTVVGGTQPYTFAWSNGSTTEDIAGLTPGNYVYTVIDANGCSVNSTVTVSEIMGITIQPIGGPDTVMVGQTIMYSLPPMSNVTYLWSVNQGTINSGQGTNEIFVAWTDTGMGLVSVTVIDSNNCQDADSLIVDINHNTGVNDINFIDNTFLYPNPSSELSILNFTSSIQTNAMLFIYADDGRLILENNVIISTGTNNLLINVSQFASGIYMIELRSAQRSLRLPLTVTK